jgi:hypothetical protein
MVGVVGSSPIAPTKQNPLCWAVMKKGKSKDSPFFVACDLLSRSARHTSDAPLFETSRYVPFRKKS